MLRTCDACRDKLAAFRDACLAGNLAEAKKKHEGRDPCFFDKPVAGCRGKTVAHLIAETRADTDCSGLLNHIAGKYSFIFDTKDDDGRTPLDIACGSQDVRLANAHVVKWLVEHGFFQSASADSLRKVVKYLQQEQQHEQKQPEPGIPIAFGRGATGTGYQCWRCHSEASHALVPCGHLVYCNSCDSPGTNCPACGRPSTNSMIIQVPSDSIPMGSYSSPVRRGRLFRKASHHGRERERGINADAE